MVTDRDEAAADADILGDRTRLISLAYRMLGTVSEAEDAVQETYARWYRMADQDRAAIKVPAAWMTRVASRICLDALSSARSRHERYVGPWLPEPVPTDAFAVDRVQDPLDRVTLDASVSMALLVLLESMTPPERVAFVLHDVFALPFKDIAEVVGRSAEACRQLAASARARVQQHRAREVSRDEHDRVVRAFSAARDSGDLQSLIVVLDPNVVLRSDGGGRVRAARNPVIGADRVARFLLGALSKWPAMEVIEQQTHDGLGFVLRLEGRVVGVITLEVIGGVITSVRMVLNPDKLTMWT